MKDEINCIFLNNNFECEIGNNTEECLKNCKDKIKEDEEKE